MTDDLIREEPYTLRVLGAGVDGDAFQCHPSEGSSVLTEARRLLETHEGCRGVEIYAGQRRLFFMHPDGKLGN